MEDTDAIAALSALAQSTRMQVFRLLVRHEPRGLPAGELARELDVPQNTLSAHLSILSQAGLLTSQRHGRQIIYRADLTGMNALVAYLLADCCAGELCLPELLTAGKNCS
jgi:DNA-binding transcriptional ArsR family regulator